MLNHCAQILEENIRELQYTYKQKLAEMHSSVVEGRVAKLEETAEEARHPDKTTI